MSAAALPLAARLADQRMGRSMRHQAHADAAFDLLARIARARGDRSLLATLALEAELLVFEAGGVR